MGSFPSLGVTRLVPDITIQDNIGGILTTGRAVNSTEVEGTIRAEKDDKYC